MGCNCNCTTEDETLVCDQDGILLADLNPADNSQIDDDWQLYIEEPDGACGFRGRKVSRAELFAGGGAGQVVPYKSYIYMDYDNDFGCWMKADGRTLTYQNDTTGDTELVTIEDTRGRVLINPNSGDELGTGVTGNGIKVGFAKSRLRDHQMPNHNHNLNDPGHSHTLERKMKTDGDGGHDESTRNNSAPWGVDGTFRILNNTTGITIQNAGSGWAHNNMQPGVGKNLFFNSCREGWTIVNVSGTPSLVALNDSNWDEDNLNDPNA